MKDFILYTDFTFIIIGLVGLIFGFVARKSKIDHRYKNATLLESKNAICAKYMIASFALLMSETGINDNYPLHILWGFLFIVGFILTEIRPFSNPMLPASRCLSSDTSYCGAVDS